MSRALSNFPQALPVFIRSTTKLLKHNELRYNARLNTKIAEKAMAIDREKANTTNTHIYTRTYDQTKQKKKGLGLLD